MLTNVIFLSLVVTPAWMTYQPNLISLPSGYLERKKINFSLSENTNTKGSSKFFDSGNILDLYQYNLEEQKDVLSMSVELTRNLDKLNQITNLVLTNSVGDVTFSKKFTSFIADILMKSNIQPEIFPNYYGNIQLEYKDSNCKEKYLEIEITPDSKMGVFKIDKDGKEFESDNYLTFDIELLYKELKSFYEW